MVKFLFLFYPDVDLARSVIGRFGGVSCGAWGGAKVLSRNYVCESLCRFCVEL
jgi:hypothetical protein